MTIPIVFIHRGYSDYMEYSLRQARAAIPDDAEIFLLGDKDNDRFDFVEHVDMTSYREIADEFLGIYRHFSTNSYDYESFCIIRWLYLLKVMQEKNIDRCMVLDTDILLFSYPDNMLRRFEEESYEISAMYYKYRNDYSLGEAIITRRWLTGFVDFCRRVYRDEDLLSEIKKKHFPVSDMSLADEFIKRSDTKVMNLLGVWDGESMDSGINHATQEYENEYKLSIFNQKAVVWKEGCPFCFNVRERKSVKMILLHYQGFAKYRMAHDYRGPAFSGKFRLDCKFFFANIAAWLYGQLISPVRFRVKRFFMFRNNVKRI